nr:MAG TPA: hypothetical protein [Caudoviricetes sp.]
MFVQAYRLDGLARYNLSLKGIRLWLNLKSA